MPTSIVHLPAESLGGLKNRRRHPAGFIVDRDIHLLCSDLLSEIDTNFACPSLDSVIDVLAEWRGYIRRLSFRVRFMTPLPPLGASAPQS
jgi:hypothetical protein